MKNLHYRIYEVFIFELLSSFIMVIIGDKFTTSDANRFMGLLSVFVIVANLVWNFIQLRKYRFKIAGKSVYYKTNFTVFAMLTVVAVVLSLIDVLEPVYSYFFAMFSMFYFFGIVKNKTVSILLVSLIFFVLVYIIPFTVKKRKHPDNNAESAS